MRTVWRWRSNAGQPRTAATTGTGTGSVGAIVETGASVVVGADVVVVVAETAGTRSATVVAGGSTGVGTSTLATRVNISVASVAGSTSDPASTPGTATGSPAPHAVIRSTRVAATASR